MHIKKCCKITNGIELTKPSRTLATSYLRKARASLQTLQAISEKDWKIVTSYYAIYFSLYAILVRIGVKCEIHACTITFVEVLLKKYFTPADINFFRQAAKTRVAAQYDIDTHIPNQFYGLMMRNASTTRTTCSDIIETIADEEIKDIRAKIS
ncbi:MAG: hypothetical protein OXR66_05460 [Candidatus Woesearchaeota archaeon]|nr:hypothetical protein [Candidatus Woesearchaeota archaeon]